MTQHQKIETTITSPNVVNFFQKTILFFSKFADFFRKTENIMTDYSFFFFFLFFLFCKFLP